MTNIQTDYLLVYYNIDGKWHMTDTSKKELQRSVLFDDQRASDLAADFSHRVNESSEHELIVAGTNATYKLIKPR